MTNNEPVHASGAKRSDLILVVDDAPTNVMVLSRILERQNYEVRSAVDGESALAAVESTMPDLILLDIMMPGISGFEVCQRLKADPRFRDIPVIFISAVGDTASKVQGFDVGGVDYITKPFETAEVVARVHVHMNLRHHQLELERANRDLHRFNDAMLGRELRIIELKKEVNALSVELGHAPPYTGILE